MKIVELTIKNVRGIKDIVLRPDKKNLVIWGPNGSGKSAVVDAVDFLITGNISRLTGEGTGGITVRKFGPHIDFVDNPKEVVVSAKVEIPGHDELVSIQRTMATPTKLGYPSEAEQHLKPVLEVAEKGQHVLSRREILKYIHSESGRREEEIMALLNLSDLDSARKALVKVKNSTKGDAETKKGYIEESERAACDTLGIPKFTNHQVVEYVSNLRQTLGADPITKLNSNEVVREIHQQEKKSEQKINIDIFRKDLDNLQSCLSEENRKLLKEADENLCRLIHDIRTDEKTHSRAFTREVAGAWRNTNRK